VAAKSRAGRPSLGHTGHSGDPQGCLACRLRRARERLGITQAELAARLRVSHRSVQRWERNAAAVDPTALQLAELLAR
jgi:DNA-binding transcriptional regulator YiaG